MPRIKLTDKKKKKIFADFTMNQNYSETARLNGVSDTTVRKIVKNHPDSLKIIEEKKEENTKDILDYMDSILDDQKEILNLSLKALKKKLANPDAFTSVKDIATAYGVVFDKALKAKEIKSKMGTTEDDGITIINDCGGSNDNS